MTSESVFVHLIPDHPILRELGFEQIKEFHANVDTRSSSAHPEIVHGRMTNATEGQIARFERALSPATVNFRGQRYKLASIDRSGAFALKHCRCI